MAEPVQSRGEEVCPRCRLAIKVDALRCPHCGERLSATSKFPLYVGIVGVLVLVFVAAIMLKTIRQADLNSADPAASQQSSQPDKIPPLNK